MQRRTFFGIVGVGAVGAALPLSGLMRSGFSDRARAETARSRIPSLGFLFAPLVGRPLPGGYRVASVSDVERGAVTVTLARQDGAEAVLQVFRRSPLSSGLATTRFLDLRWMNGADGEQPTHEAGGVAVMSLAARLRRIEAAMLRGGLDSEHRVALRALSTHEQRTARHGGFRDGSAGPALA